LKSLVGTLVKSHGVSDEIEKRGAVIRSAKEVQLTSLEGLGEVPGEVPVEFPVGVPVGPPVEVPVGVPVGVPVEVPAGTTGQITW
jgi:hypothetical protein